MKPDTSHFVCVNPELSAPRKPERVAPWPPPEPRPAPAAKATAQPYNGAALWASRHKRALTWTGGDDMAWISRTIFARLPCGECTRHARAYLQDHPPVFEAIHYFAWTVAFHNAVNQRLGRPLWSLDDAAQHWRVTPVP